MIRSSFLPQLNRPGLDFHPQSNSTVQCHDMDLIDTGGAERVPPTKQTPCRTPVSTLARIKVLATTCFLLSSPT